MGYPLHGAYAFVLLFFACVSHAAAPTAAQIDSARVKGLAWLLLQQNGEGAWKNQPGNEVITTTAILDAFDKAGAKGAAFSRGIGWLGGAKALSADSPSRKAVALHKAGLNAAPLITSLIAMRSASTRSWGAYANYAGTFPDTPLAMDAIRITSTSYADEGYGIGFMTSGQNTDGGWSYNKVALATPPSDIMPTAYTLLALNRYKVNYAVQTNITNGLAWLKSKQKTSGAFGEGSAGTVYETALAYLALVAELGTADVAAGNALRYLVSAQLIGGSWESGPFATGLALQALNAPSTPLIDTDKDGIPNGVETLVGTNPSVADGQVLVAGNGNSVAGLTVALKVGAEVQVGTLFSYSLSATGGTAPYSWQLLSGSLPPGLSLSSTGVISGTPTALGTFNFSYLATDSAKPQAKNSEVGQINVFRSRPTLATGDINLDSIVDVKDVVLVERFALGLALPTAAQRIAADVAPVGTPDGVINATDVARIRLKALSVAGF